MAAAGGRVEKEQIRKAVEAVMKLERSRKGREKAQLLEFDHLLYLILSFTNHPDKVRTNPYRIPIPHPFFSLDLCLFVDDRRSPLAPQEAKQKLAQQNIRVSKVIGLSKLTSDYVPFEAKRKLSGSYDLFLADRAVVPELPKLIGKTFYRKKKHPIPVDLIKKDWRKQIEAVCGSTFFYIKGGTCSVLKVGRFAQTNDEIVENISAAIDGIASVIPKRWKNVRSILLKTSESVALPLYQVFPEAPFRINCSQDKVKKENKEQDPDAKDNISDSQNDSADTDMPVLGEKRPRLPDHNRDLDLVKPKSRRKKATVAELGKVDQMAKPQLRDENLEDEKSKRRQSKDSELAKIDAVGMQEIYNVNTENKKSRKKFRDSDFRRPFDGEAINKKGQSKKASDFESAEMGAVTKSKTFEFNVDSKDTESDDSLCANMIVSSGRCSYDTSMHFSSIDSKARKKGKGLSVSKKDHTKKKMAEL